ncbi:AEC family transporter [Gracilibacillus caseinilyticus]|uniref:AEC family transporter n=1 Tax=Gracilibacillus caseinilyticus TaxID=2932256 RepID=A0ABY4ETI4_9BACI|nr:AEC family transporter [Gracilibacillus caseinilyticus]UOQ47072.1 AEC family transporter [Gracilibacillus caseinilyticus]
MNGFNEQFFISIVIIAIGYLLKRMNIVKEKDGEGIARVIFNLTLPCLIIVTFNDMEFTPSLFYLIVIAFIYGVFNALAGLFVFRKHSKDMKGTFGMMVPGLNIGLFAYPLVEGLFGFEGLQYFGMFDVGNAFIVFGLSYIIAGVYAGNAGMLETRSIILKLAKSIPLQTYLIMCLLNIFNFSLPDEVLNVTSVISVANMPLSLLLLGLYLNFSFAKGYGKLLSKFLLTKYGIGLISGFACYVWLPVEDMFKFTLLIGFILPTPASVLPYAIMFGYNQRMVGTASNLTMMISFLLIWCIVNIVV